MQTLQAKSWRDLRNLSVPQRAFLDALTCQGEYRHLKNPRVLYGGAGFGGKSYGLRSACVELNGYLASLGFPGCWGALFCVDYPRLADRHIKHLTRELGDLGRVKFTKTMGLHFECYEPALGGFFLRNVADPNRGKGIEYDWMLLDELTEFTRDEYDDLRYQLRNARGLPFEAFGGATNPDGIGHAWVRKLWIDRDFEDELGLKAEDHVFIPAKAWDNPAFNEERASALMSFKDPMKVKARWEGSWDLTGGMRFAFRRGIHTFSWEEFEAAYGGDVPWPRLLENRDLFEIYGSLDYGTDESSASAFYLHAIDFKGRVWTFHESYLSGMYLAEQAAVIRPLVQQWAPLRVFCDPSLRGTDSDGISRLSKFKDQGVMMTPGINDRIEGWATLEMLLHCQSAHGVLELPPRWRVHEGCREAIRFMMAAPRDEKRPEDVSKKFRNDHAGDALRYGLHSYFRIAPGLARDEASSSIVPAHIAALRRQQFEETQERPPRNAFGAP